MNLRPDPLLSKLEGGYEAAWVDALSPPAVCRPRSPMLPAILIGTQSRRQLARRPELAIFFLSLAGTAGRKCLSDRHSLTAS